MKKILSGLFFLGVMGLISSCEKKLDLFPYSSIERSQSFKTVKDAEAWNIGIFSNLRGRLYGLYTYSQDVQADQLNASLDFGNRNGNPHRWGDSFLADDYTIRDVWSGYYFMLKNVNAAIEGYPTIPTNTTAEANSIQVFLGNAHMARAYIYYELVIRFAKPYSAATAATDLGVPLVLKYDPTEKPSRATIKAVYDQILSDLDQAKSKLSGIAGKKGATVFTIHSVKSLEARVKLSMEDWPGAKAAADEVINSGIYVLYNTEDGLKAMWGKDETQETIQQAFVSAPSELANTNSIYLGLNSATGRYVPDFIPSQWVIDMYEDDDIRKNVYFQKKELTIQGLDYSDIWLVNKYPGNPALFTGATTNYQQAPKVFRVAELYLISAEASAKIGGAAEADALTRLNTLRTARGLTALTGIGGADLLSEIKDERFRELAFEGFRLWDLKRWREGFQRHDAQNLDIINTGDKYNTLSVSANDAKFVWAIPVNDMTTNPSLANEQNPGW